MKKLLVALVATLVAVSVAGCAGLGKGKGKAPPPVVTKVTRQGRCFAKLSDQVFGLRGPMLFRAGRSFFTAGCVWLAGVALANAADIPYAVQSAPPVPWTASWAGFYLGGQVGWGGDD